MEALRRRLAVARGDEPADLVVRGGRVLSVFTKEWLETDVAIVDGVVAGLGSYEGRETLDASGHWVAPGFIDAHMHLESTKLLPDEFAQPRPAPGNDGGRGRSARARERARHRRRALAARRVRGPAVRLLLHGFVLRSGLALRVAPPPVHDRGSREPAPAKARARSGRDDELPGRHRRRRVGAREARPRGERPRRRPRAGRARQGAERLCGGRDPLRPRGAHRRRGHGSACAPACGS